ncbi:MlaD family protein [Zhouia sp. PK063]|uniref:MlaD family protein n=1 Tax=Zhouia sp. PK063 TaxID=3373602 RepID=UPI0037B6A753
MKLTKELKTGIIIVGGIVLFIVGFSFLKSSSLFSNKRTYYAIYDNVEGLSKSSPVTINGYPVGKIEDISFYDETGKLKVTMSVDSDFEFSKDSQAQLYDTGIIGGKSIQIIPVIDGSGTAEDGIVLKSTVKPGITELVKNKLTPLQEKVEKMVTSADSLLTSINNVLGKNNRDGITNSIADFQKTMANLNAATASLNTMLANKRPKLEATIDNAERLSNNFAKISDTIASVQFGKVVKDLEHSLSQVNGLLEDVSNGKGTLGKLMTDDAAYKNLEIASQQMRELLQDIKLHPKRYVHFSIFGKRPKDYEKPEDPRE